MSSSWNNLNLNLNVQAPDGALLCTCSQKKAMWYIERSLADKVCDDPLTVQLRFEPQGRESAEEKYYLVRLGDRALRRSTIVLLGTGEQRPTDS